MNGKMYCCYFLLAAESITTSKFPSHVLISKKFSLVVGIATMTANKQPLVLESREALTIISKLIRVLLNVGPNQPNLFESEVDLDRLEALHQKFFSPNGQPYENSGDIEDTPLPIVAQLLLDCLLRLTEPLLTHRYYDSFILTQYIVRRSDQAEICLELVSTLPPRHRTVVHQVLTLLRHLSTLDYSPQQLATVFGNIFLRPFKTIYYMDNDPALVFKIVAFLIENFSALLGVEEEEKDDVSKYGQIDLQTKPRSGSIRQRGSTVGTMPSPYISDMVT